MAQAQETALAYLGTVLKDPHSLKDFRIISGPTWFSWYYGDSENGGHQEAWLICFEYNAKNGSGAYMGLAVDGIAIRLGADNKPQVVEPVNWALASSQCST